MAMITVSFYWLFVCFGGSNTYKGLIQNVFHRNTTCVVGLDIKGWKALECLN